MLRWTKVSRTGEFANWEISATKTLFLLSFNLFEENVQDIISDKIKDFTEKYIKIKYILQKKERKFTLFLFN